MKSFLLHLLKRKLSVWEAYIMIKCICVVSGEALSIYEILQKTGGSLHAKEQPQSRMVPQNDSASENSEDTKLVMTSVH